MTEAVCPLCGTEAADISESLAPNQAYCSSDCPVRTWDPTETLPELPDR